jgi:plastocyanin
MGRLNRARPAWVGLFLVSVLLGCGGDGGDSNGGTPPPTTAIAKTSTNSGDAQSGTVGQPLANALRVVVTEDGAPLSGATVAWATTAAGGSVDPASAATGADGVANTTWTLGTVSGAQTATATLSGASGSPVTFAATATAAAATTIAEAGGNSQTGEIGTQLGTPVQAKVSDQFGNGVEGVVVAWEASGGTVSAASVPTDAAGISAVNVTLGSTAGPVTITATVDGLGGSPLTFNATATVPAPIPTTAAITVGNIFFRSNRNNTEPAVDTVAVGGSVTWTWVNTGAEPHSVRSTGSPSFPSSGILTGNGESYNHTFSIAGTYNYDCSVHGSQMTGRIVVR